MQGIFGQWHLPQWHSFLSRSPKPMPYVIIIIALSLLSARYISFPIVHVGHGTHHIHYFIFYFFLAHNHSPDQLPIRIRTRHFRLHEISPQDPGFDFQPCSCNSCKFHLNFLENPSDPFKNSFLLFRINLLDSKESEVGFRLLLWII